MKQATLRLQKELVKIEKESIPNILARPLQNNILEWHYVIFDIQDKESPYRRGYYHGKIIFPEQYPFKPPDILMITPNGRFLPNTKLCLSMSSFHPESWNPMWSVSTILTGLLSFMQEDKSTHGSMTSSFEEKVVYAKRSFAFNCKNSVFLNLFPEVIEHEKANRLTPEEEKKTVVEVIPEEVSILSSILYTILFIVLASFVGFIAW